MPQNGIHNSEKCRSKLINFGVIKYKANLRKGGRDIDGDIFVMQLHSLSYFLVT
jgi:hypothetical protein